MSKEFNLTPNQIRFFEELRAYWQREGRPPTVRELQEIMGLKSPRSVGQYLDALENVGVIERGTGARNIRIRRTPSVSLDDVGKTVRVPVVGIVAAGLPVLAQENIKQHLSVSVKLARPPHHYFILEVNGDSMDKAGINDGDRVLVRQQPVADEGQTVVALIDDNATIKKIHFQKDYVILEPISKNTKNHPIILERDFQIQGVVLTVLPKP